MVVVTWSSDLRPPAPRNPAPGCNPADDGRRPEAIERIARDVLAYIPEGEEAAQEARRILAAFLGLGEGDEFDAALLEQMTPELIFRLDMIAAELLEFGRTNEAVRALRGALIRSVN